MEELEDKFLDGCYTPDGFVPEVEQEQPPTKKVREEDKENTKKTGRKGGRKTSKGSSRTTEKGKKKKTETKRRCYPCQCSLRCGSTPEHNLRRRLS